MRNNYLKIDRQIKEINFFLMILIKQLQQQVLRILIRYVPNHNSRPAINLYSLQIDWERIHLGIVLSLAMIVGWVLLIILWLGVGLWAERSEQPRRGGCLGVGLLVQHLEAGGHDLVLLWGLGVDGFAVLLRLVLALYWVRVNLLFIVLH